MNTLVKSTRECGKIIDQIKKSYDRIGNYTITKYDKSIWDNKALHDYIVATLKSYGIKCHKFNNRIYIGYGLFHILVFSGALLACMCILTIIMLVCVLLF